MSHWVPLHLPLAEADARRLAVGDMALLSGALFTARDAVHHFLATGGEAPCDLRNATIFHCGPVIVRDGDAWRVTAAGPTTSDREEPYMATIIRRFGIRGIIGKGGMGPGTLAACREVGCAYFQAVGGAAQVLAARICDVRSVYLLERFGAPEAVWELEVAEFPVTVTMDSHGRSLHTDVLRASEKQLQTLLT